MSSNSLKEYGELFNRLELTEMTVEEGGFKLTMKKESAKAQNSMATSISTTLNERGKTDESAENKGSKEASDLVSDTKSGTEIKSPLLGIFYGAVSGKEPLNIGDKVKKGDVICTIEAMKMMNEVKATVDGTVAQILAKDGDLVEFDQVLFVIGE